MLRYCGPFLFLLSIPFFYYGVGAAAPLISVGLLLAAPIGAEVIAPRGDGRAPVTNRGFRVLVFGYIPLQLAANLWGMLLARHEGALGFAALALALGVTTGVFGVLAAHEGVHSKSSGERFMGGLLLTGMSYRHFRIAHIHGHHRWAGTVNDAATARLGEGFYHFLFRTVAGQFLEAWRFEQRRHGSRLYWDIGVMAALFAVITILLGPRALLFFFCQSVIAVMVLELFNYIAHYGLARGPCADGRLPALGDHHSWNSSNVFANYLIFNMGRHSDHHRRPTGSYHELKMRSAPELPYGYAGSIMLALVPPMWRRAMDAHVLAWPTA